MDVHGASEYFAQASQALEPEVLKDPAVQPKHFDIESAPRIAENVPAGHLGCHEFSGANDVNSRTVHLCRRNRWPGIYPSCAWQASGEPAATAVEKLPVGQAVQAVPFSA